MGCVYGFSNPLISTIFYTILSMSTPSYYIDARGLSTRYLFQAEVIAN